MRRKSFARAGAICALALAAALALARPHARRQTDVTTGRISGTVRDTDGGPLPGVTVEGRNQGTGLARSSGHPPGRVLPADQPADGSPTP